MTVAVGMVVCVSMLMGVTVIMAMVVAVRMIVAVFMGMFVIVFFIRNGQALGVVLWVDEFGVVVMNVYFACG